MTNTALTILIIIATIAITAWLLQRQGGVKIIRFPSTDGPPGLTKELAVTPPTRWQKLTGQPFALLRQGLMIVGLLAVFGWLLGGCTQ